MITKKCKSCEVEPVKVHTTGEIHKKYTGLKCPECGKVVTVKSDYTGGGHTAETKVVADWNAVN